MSDLLLLTSRKEWAVLISVLSVLGAAAAIAFGDMSARSLIAAGLFIVAIALTVSAIRPRRSADIPMTVLSGLLPRAAAYTLIAPQVSS